VALLVVFEGVIVLIFGLGGSVCLLGSDKILKSS
jgi:hypothetical protein